MHEHMGKNALAYPHPLKVGAVREDAGLQAALIASIAISGGRAKPLDLEAHDPAPELTDFLLFLNLILIISPAALRIPTFRAFLERAWHYQAHIHPPAILLLVLAAPLEGGEVGSWPHELPCVATSDGQPLPLDEAIRQTLHMLGLLASGQPEEASSRERLFLQGKVLWHLGQEEQSIACLKTGIERDPQFFRGWYTLGASLGWLPGRKEEALAAFDHALALEPGAVNAWNWQGGLLKELGRVVESQAAYERALTCDREGILSWEERARILHYELQRYEEARAAYEQVARQYPKEVFMYFGMGLVLGLLGRAEEALAAYERFLVRYPEDGNAWYNQAELYESLDRHEEALSALDQAQRAYEADAEADPTDLADVWLDRAVILQKRDRLVEALQAVDQALALVPPQSPTSDLIWKRKAEVLRGLGREEEAQAAEAQRPSSAPAVSP